MTDLAFKTNDEHLRVSSVQIAVAPVEGPRQPIWMTAKQALQSRIQELPPGSALPSYEQLAASMNCSVAPIRQAVRELAREGCLSLSRGRKARVLWSNSFSQNARRFGRSPTNRIVETAFRNLQPEESSIGESLEIQAGQPCIVCTRVRCLDDRPASLQMAYINPVFFPHPERFFLDYDVVHGSLRMAYAGLGVRPLRIDAVLTSALADSRERSLLSLPSGSPVLRSRQHTVVDAHGTPRTLEILLATYSSDIEFHVQRLPQWMD